MKNKILNAYRENVEEFGEKLISDGFGSYGQADWPNVQSHHKQATLQILQACLAVVKKKKIREEDLGRGDITENIELGWNKALDDTIKSLQEAIKEIKKD